MIKVKCPNADCGKMSQVKDEFAGKRAKCPACAIVGAILSLISLNIIGLLIDAAYAVLVFVVLLNKRYAAEFR
jgi:hypothetical protein